MAKALNQNFYTSILYGSENASGTLRLESTLSATKGVVQVVGTSMDLIIGGQIGRLIHANTALRTYTLPDFDGTLLSGGTYTAANQIIYSTGANTVTVLNSIGASILSTTAPGVPNWITGTNGQFLQMAAGLPTFANLPSNIGTIADSVGETLPIYQSGGPSNDLVPLATSANRVLTSPSGVLTWDLIKASYLAASGFVPLSNGTAGQKLKSNGDGTFVWANDPNVINAGNQYFISYYSGPGSSSTLSASSFLQVDEPSGALKLNNQGVLRLYEQTINGTSFVGLQAPSSLTSSPIFTLPAADGASGAFLTTDGSGNLSFAVINNGVVNAGLINQLTYYAANGNTVSGLTTTSNRTLLSPAGVPTWGLVSAPYLAGLGNIPLVNGAVNDVLVSNGDGTFSWVIASTLTGSVNSGTMSQAAYYAANGTAVSGSSFVNFVDASKQVQLTNNGALRFYEATVNGTDYVEFKAPASLAGSISFNFPSADGSLNYALVTDGSANLSFAEVGLGIVNAGTANTLALYTGGVTGTGNGILSPLASVASRTLLTDGAGVPNWSLITEGYLSTSGSIPLSGGLNQNVLTSDGFGNFVWDTVSNIIGGGVGPGSSGAVPYYPASGTAVQGSTFLFINNGAAQLLLRNGGALRFYEATTTNYVGFIASASLATDITWTLPIADALSNGEVLVSDGAGTLSFASQVGVGTTNALAFYTGASRFVTPTGNITYTGSALNFFNTPTFGFVGETGPSPVSLNMQAGSGVGVAGADIILNSGGTDSGVYGTIFMEVDSTQIMRIENLNPGLYASIPYLSSLRFVDSPATGYVGFTAPAAVTASVIWSLPVSDGSVSSNDVMATDGSGNLYWRTITPPAVTVNSGVTNALAYYTSPTTVDNSVLLAPAIVPDTSSFLTIDTTGQISYSPEKQGNVLVPSGANSITVIYEDPFAVAPSVILAQWSHEGATAPISLPTVSVQVRNAEGFTLQFSTTTTQDYFLYWKAIQNGGLALAASAFFAGGNDGGVLSADVQALAFDTDSTVFSVVTLSSARGYTASSSSATDGFILGGTLTIATTSTDAITTFNYTSTLLTDQANTLTVARSDAAGVGNRTKGYACGGQTLGSGTLTSIDAVDHATFTATSLVAVLTSTAVDRGSANSSSAGYIVHDDALSTVDILAFTTETIALSASSFNVTNIQVGCNDNINSIGYFGRSNGDLYSYNFSSNVIIPLGVSTTSVTGLSGAANSLTNGYFSGATTVDRFNFATSTSVAVSALSLGAAVGASISTFQTNGLI